VKRISIPKKTYYPEIGIVRK